jgi:hypothetical protein
MKRGCLLLVVLILFGWVAFSILGSRSPLQRYYDKIDQMTPLELDQEYAKLIRTMTPRERADEANQVQLFPGAEHERRALKYHAATSGMSDAWNDLGKTVKAFPNLPVSASPSPTDSDIAASPTPTPHKHHTK